MKMKKINLLFAAMCFAFSLFAQTIADFEGLSLSTDSFWNGADLSGGFSNGNAYFVNDYNTTYDSWSGFAYSNKTDVTTPGYTNQYSAITGQGFYGSANYAVGDDYGNAKVRLTGNASGKLVEGVYVTNATYAYLVMRDGDAIVGAKKFGGTSGNDEDWFKLTAKGWFNGMMKGGEVNFYLADFRASNNAQDYMVNTWEWMDLRPLGNVDSIQFFLSSSDNGQWGMNTPAYFCLDNFITAEMAVSTPQANDDYVNVTYVQDTIIDVLSNDVNNTAAALMVELISTPMIPGAYATDTNGTHIFYSPAVGIVAVDTLFYRTCNPGMECDTAMLLVDVSSLQSVNEVMISTGDVSPNPFTGSFSVKLPLNVSSMVIYNVEGREVMRERFMHQSGSYFVNTIDIAPGIYFMRLMGEDVSASVKLVKQ